jgi:phage terminase large subunit-like protein
MTFGAGDTREQPIWLVITTAGDDPDRNSIGWEIHEKAQKIISGELIDPRWHCVVYGAEEGDDIYDEKIWYKVNPSLGTVIDINKVRNAAIGAKQSSAEEKLFKWLRLNIWIDNKSQSWINQTVWDANNLEGFDKTQLAGMKCYGGLDLSSTTDLSALTLGFPPQMGLDHWFLIMFAWIPLDNMKKRVKFDHVPYDKWVNEGWLTATPGNCIDYDFIENKILEVYKLYDVITIGTDPWNSRALTQRCAKQGVDFIEVPQTMAGMSPAMKHTESLLKKQQLKHEKNPVARWCFGNVAVAVDGNENIKPMKNKSKDRIDITVSMINMVAIAMRTEVDSIYEGKGLTII